MPENLKDLAAVAPLPSDKSKLSHLQSLKNEENEKFFKDGEKIISDQELARR